MKNTYTTVILGSLPGPITQFGALSIGNIASSSNKKVKAFPKKTALESLEKMLLLHNLGVQQIIFPPHNRPNIEFLQSLGFSGSEQSIIEKALQENPRLLEHASSSSYMWMANSATVTPSCDTEDKKLHITVANLGTHLHRSIEAPWTLKLFQTVFKKIAFFTIHPPLLGTYQLFDEGAANHIRLTLQEHPLHLFVYGRNEDIQDLPHIFQARQTRLAQESIVKSHTLQKKHVLFLQQNPKAIDLGVFHNDIIASGKNNFLLLHEEAFTSLEALKQYPLQLRIIKKQELSVEDAIKSYFFNAALIELNNKSGFTLLAPSECKKNKKATKLIKNLIQDPEIPIHQVEFISLSQSMQNGGGPRCLELELLLNKEEINAIHRQFFFSEKLYKELKNCIETFYPEEYTLLDLKKSSFRKEISSTLKKITTIMGFSDLYQ